jgi:flagellin-specific chaperone FliS
VYTAAGSLVNKRTIIALLSLLIIPLPLSASAESLIVITNKDIYTHEENAIIVGTVPTDAPDGYGVLIKVTGQEGDCTVQNILPAADNSFVSRPVKLDECGLGEFTVSAFYAELEATSTFTISGSSQANAGGKMELRMLKNVVLQAQDTVNARVKELVQNGYFLPEDVAKEYSEGVSEGSLALQAIEFGDATDAKKHMIFAFRDFREVLDALSDENMALLAQTAGQRASSGDNAGIAGTYNSLKEYYLRIEQLAEKNQVDKDELEDAALLLTNAKRMIEDRNFEGAERNLERVNALLEQIRTDLFDNEEKKNLASNGNGTNQADGALAKKLADAADRFERMTLQLLNETGSDTEAWAKLRGALSLLANAKTSIEAQDLESAREALSTAYTAIHEVREILEDEKDNNSGKSSDNDSDGGSSDTGEEEEGSDSGSNEHSKDDQ